MRAPPNGMSTQEMKSKSLNRSFNTRFAIALIALTTILTSGSAPAWAGQSQDCTAFGDSSTICAPISQLAQALSNGTAVPVSDGAAFLATSATSVKFIFTSNSANSGKNIYLQFFDISDGLTLTLPTPTCRSGEIASKGCVTAVDASGSATINVSISGASAGKYFKYQLNGPAGFTSGFVTTTFTSSGGGGSTPEVCGGDSSTVCAPITRLSATSGGKSVSVSYDAKTQDGTAIISPNTTSITYKFGFPSDYMNKYVFVQFFDVATLSLTVPGGSINSSTTCDPQPAANRGCKLKIDGDGKASFTVSVSGTSIGANFKYIIAGPNYASHVVLTTVAMTPTMSVTGSKGKFIVYVNDAKGRSAIVTYKVGKKQKTATLRVISDKSQFNIPAAKGKYTVQVRVGKESAQRKITVK